MTLFRGISHISTVVAQELWTALTSNYRLVLGGVVSAGVYLALFFDWKLYNSDEFMTYLFFTLLLSPAFIFVGHVGLTKWKGLQK